MRLFQIIIFITIFIPLALTASAQTIGYVYDRDVEVAFANGVNAYIEGDYETAITELDMVIRKNPDKAYAHYYRGKAFKQMGELKIAVSEFSRAIELNPRIANAQSELVQTYQMMGNIPAALREFESMLSKFSDKKKILRDRGTLYEETGDTVNALLDYKRAGANFEALNLYWKKKEYLSAIEQINVMLSNLKEDKGNFFIPPYPDLLHSRGMAYYKLGLIDDALYDLKEAIHKNPDFADALYLRGIIYFQKGLYDNAAGDFKRTLKINPDNFEAFKYLVHSKKKMKLRR